MILEDLKINIKIFQINRAFYELKGKSFDEILEIIQANHLKALNAKFDDMTNINISLVRSKDEEFEYASYCYNQPKDQYYWKLFLPEPIIQEQDFQIIEFSYVLFMLYKESIYCVIGGSGNSVIQKYANQSFGIEVYQHLAKPKKDMVIEVNTRGIASNISQKKHTYNLNQTISETLEYSEIPTKIKLVVRDELKKTELKKYNLDKDRAILEVGSYFNLRKKISFKKLKILLKDIYEWHHSSKFVPLTLFNKVSDSKQISELDNTLQEKLIDDIIAVNSQGTVLKQQEDIVEVVHPTKLEKFYECNRFIIKAKYSRGKDDVEVTDRSDIYNACIKHINNRLEDVRDRFKIKGELYKLNIVGHLYEKQLTYKNCYDHIVAEINLLNKKYFRIDGNWYYVKDDFLKLMTEDAVDYYQKYKLRTKILKKWLPDQDEDKYNLSHKKNNYYVLDKRFQDNIELCDILIEKEGQLYFVHVKNEFSTKLRECYIQLVLSAKRLSVDLKDGNGEGYLRSTLEYYNSYNHDNTIDVTNILERLLKKELNIVFVMAYNNYRYEGDTDVDKIRKSKSNIAKYSVVQVVKEMQPYFDIKVIDISGIKKDYT